MYELELQVVELNLYRTKMRKHSPSLLILHKQLYSHVPWFINIGL